MPSRIDITGQKYGRLLVVGYAFTKKKTAYWICKCDCGNTCTIAGSSIKRSHTQSCGCLHKEQLVRRQKKYKTDAPNRLYHIWHGIIRRCELESESSYCNYGGRGISVCVEWHDYDNFASWALKNGYADNLSIDRIDNDKCYCPENCRWATRKEQENNKRSNRKVTINGETKTLAQWCEDYNINPVTVQSRLRYGWTIEKAIKEPVNHKYHPPRRTKLEGTT